MLSQKLKRKQSKRNKIMFNWTNLMKEKMKGLLKRNLHEMKEDIKEDKKLAKAMGSKSKKMEHHCECEEPKMKKKKK